MIELKELRFFLCLLLLICCSGFVSFSQPSKKSINEINKFFDSKNYREAYPLVRKIYNSDSSYYESNYFMGVCYLMLSKGNDKAIYYLNKSIMGSEFNPKAYYYLGRAYHFSNKFDEAISYYRKYILAGDGNSKELSHEYVQRKIEMCENGKILIKKNLKTKIKNLEENVNSEYDESSIAISADEKELLFTSKRSGSNSLKDVDGQYMEDIFITESEKNVWIQSRRYDSVLVTQRGKTIWDENSYFNTKYPDAVAGLSTDGRKLFIYRYNQQTSGDIYLSRAEKRRWSAPEKLSDTINTKYWEGSACMTADETTIYFSSDRPGGYGGLDIYRSIILPDGNYGHPENLGPAINTAEDEDAPFILNDGKTLYFSSRGHNSIGDYDIFRSIYSGGYWSVNKLSVAANVTGLDSTYIVFASWSSPENVGYPINSTADDIYFIISASGQHVYFSSRREGTIGGMDIFEADVPGNWKRGTVLLQGTITADGIPIEAIITIKDKTTGKIQGFYKSSAASGQYVIVLEAGNTYTVTAEAPGYFSEETVNTGSIADSSSPQKQITKNVSLAKRFDDNTLTNKGNMIISFKVQVVAFSSNTQNTDELFVRMKKKNWMKDMEITKEVSPNYTRYLLGDFEKLSDAIELKNRLINEEGINDAWIVPYYREKK